MSSSKRNYAIGVFDSGVGGLTVVKELIKQLPHEDIVYFGDTARVPYGTKSISAVRRFSQENTQILRKHRVKAIVVACNTSSSVAFSIVQRTFKGPVIGVLKPGVKRALAGTKNKTIGVIATAATIHSGAYKKEIKKNNRSIKVVSQACPLLVPLAEEGLFNKKITRDIVREYLKGIKRAKADTLILGCTHYPLLKEAIKKVVGKNVTLIDSAEAVAGSVRELLTQSRLLTNRRKKGQYTFLASDEPAHFAQIARAFLGFKVKKVKKVT